VITNWSGTIVELGTNNPASWWGAAGDPNMAFFGFEGVTDGTSNTALFSEKLYGLNASTGAVVTAGGVNGKRGLYLVNYNGAYNTGKPANAVAAIAACKTLPPAQSDAGQEQLSGAFWSAGYPWAILINEYNHFNTPNLYSCYSGSDTSGGSNVWGGTSGMITATSNHPGGVNVCMADGSVKFMKDTVNPQTWWAIGTRNQGEVISADAY
jgi:prepilin-type processing-associated H-X9-DG protein